MDDLMKEVVRHMVQNADDDGVFHGSPREKMEELGVSSGARYKQLYDLGITRTGRARKGKWTIPPEVIANYG